MKGFFTMDKIGTRPSTKIILAVFAVFGIIWSVSVLAFLPGNMLADIRDVLATALLYFTLIIGFYPVFSGLTSKIKYKSIRYAILLVLFSVGYTFVVLNTPYSPNHDSFDLELMLTSLAKGEEFGFYYSAYSSFYVTNKLVLYLYYPFTLMFDDIQLAVRVANAVFIWIGSVGVSAAAGQLKGFNAAQLALMIMLVLCPALLFSGPYIYPPAIALTALTLAFYANKEPAVRVFGYIFAGILFCVRPLSLGVFLVYAIGKSFVTYSKFYIKLMSSVFRLILIFAVCTSVKWYIGQVMYKTHSHPLPNLGSAMELWTIEIGTRDQDNSTGYANYTPASVPYNMSDDISFSFNKLWNLYSDAEFYNDEIIKTKNYISKKLTDRIANEILSSPADFSDFFAIKFSNYYKDYYKPYFYALDICDTDAKNLLIKNYDYRYFLYENTLLVMFYTIGAVGVIFALIRILRKRRAFGCDSTLILLFIGVAATSLVSILLTEVGKRLIFDTFVPMMIVLSMVLSGISDLTSGKKFTAAGIITCIISLTGLFSIYKSIEIPIFKDASVHVYEDKTLLIDFGEPIKDDGYIYVDAHSQEFSMTGYDTLFVKYDVDFSTRPVHFGIKLPDGQHLYVSYFN